MDHPLLSSKQKSLRQRVARLLKNAYQCHRQSNILFVCGGNDPTHMRAKFRCACETKLTNFDVFFPEFAMETIYAEQSDGVFDLAAFEELIGRLAHAVIIFPEAPGSFAETGYFAALKNVASRSILVMDTNRQKYDSFISLGPAKKFEDLSLFRPVIQINYKDPDFDPLFERIEQRRSYRFKKHLNLADPKKITDYEFFCLIFKIVDLLRVATFPDVLYMLRSLFRGKVSESQARKLFSILAGSKSICQIGEFGHFQCNTDKKPVAFIRDGFREEERAVRLEVIEICEAAGTDFNDILSFASDAA